MYKTAVVVASWMAVAAPTAQADVRRVATLAPEGSLWMKQLEKGAALVRKATEGRVETKYYGGGSQGDEKDFIRKMRMKQLDGAALTSIGLSQIYPGIRVLQLPQFFASVEELDYVRERMWPYFQEKFRSQGFELLTPGDVGWIHLFSTVPVRTRDDLKGVNLWVWQGDPAADQLIKQLGINGIPLGVPEVLPALSSGRINACFGSPLAAVALQWHTRVRYMTSMRVLYGIGAMVMRTDVWTRASAQDIKVQRLIANKMTKSSLVRIRRDNERALQALKREGLQIVDTAPKLLAEFEKEAEKTWQAGVGGPYTQAEFDMAKRYRDEFRQGATPSKSARK
jgi:TRAP-type transport system periplasmic protein